MAIALDIIIAAIILITVIMGTKRGFISAVFDFCKFLASVILAFVFKDTVSEYIMGTRIFDGVKVSVSNALTEAISNAGENISSSEMLAAFEKENATLLGIIEFFGGSFEKAKEWISGMSGEDGNAAELAAQYIIEPASRVCSQVIAFIAIFAASLIVLALLKKLLNLIFELPVLRHVNKTGGFLIGCVCAFLYVSLFCAAASVLLSNSELFGIVIPENTAKNTVLFKFFAENNLFTYIGLLFGEPGQNTVV